jgi:pimeloyl-ACP methyl ester carboxylesterase
MIALIAAAHRPDLVKGLIIGDAPLDLQVLKNLVDSQRDTATRYINWLRTGQNKKFLNEFNNDEFQVSTISHCDPEMLSAQFESFNIFFEGYDPKILFPLICCPTLIVRGSSKLGSLVSNLDILAVLKLLPNLKQIELPNEGHSLFKTDRTSLVNAIKSFVYSVYESVSQ